jgi:hypothetical protein
MIENNISAVSSDANDETASEFKTVHLALNDLVHEPKSPRAGKPSSVEAAKGMARMGVEAKFDLNGDDTSGS